MPKTRTTPISAHRAFIYAAALPGWGEWYTGAKLRGICSGTAFLAFSVWFIAIVFQVISQFAQLASDYLQGNTGMPMPTLPYTSFASSLLGIYFIWLWAMISAVNLAGKSRTQNGENLQQDIAWGIGISWLCPGAGQIYSAKHNSGYVIFAAYLVGFLMMIPVYMQMVQELSVLVKNGHEYAGNPLAVIAQVRQITGAVEYSFAQLFQGTIRYLAIAGVCEVLKIQGKIKETALRFLSFLLVGWLCPGSGQLLQGRKGLGWLLLGLVLSCRLLISLNFGADLIGIETAEKLSWALSMIIFFAMVEAAVKDLRPSRTVR